MIQNCQRSIAVAVRPLEDFLRRAQAALRLPSAEVGVRFVSDAAIARMNRAFRRKHGATDVLSFPANGSRQGHVPARGYLGDIAIAPAIARRNARRYGRALDAELRILLLHGLLHLLGYDHEADHGEMDRFERRLRGRLGLD